MKHVKLFEAFINEAVGTLISGTITNIDDSNPYFVIDVNTDKGEFRLTLKAFSILLVNSGKKALQNPIGKTFEITIKKYKEFNKDYVSLVGTREFFIDGKRCTFSDSTQNGVSWLVSKIDLKNQGL